MLAPKEIAYELKVSYKTVMRLIKVKKLVAYKIGRHYKVSKNDFYSYLEENKI